MKAERILNSYGFLFNEYKLKFYLWEFIVAGRKISVCLCTAMVQLRPDLIQMQAVTGLLVTELLISLHFKPHRDKVLNKIYSLSLISLFCVSLSSLHFIDSDDIPHPFPRWLSFTIVLASTLYFLVFWFRCFVRHYSSYLIHKYPKCCLVCCLCRN